MSASVYSITNDRVINHASVSPSCPRTSYWRAVSAVKILKRQRDYAGDLKDQVEVEVKDKC